MPDFDQFTWFLIITLLLISGIAWTIVYINAILVGFRQKTYAMPLFALALNLAWEGLYTYTGIRDGSNIQTWINLVWFLLDLVIVYTYLKFGRQEFAEKANPKTFIVWTILAFAMAIAIQIAFDHQFAELGSWYSAFIQNLVMSMLFIDMLHRRKSRKGQSLTIAISKWIGTLAPTILFGYMFGNQLVLVVGIFCSIFDIIYILDLASTKKYETGAEISA